MVEKIISIHIPRTAGGTFGRGVLSQIHFQVSGWYTELYNIAGCENGLIDNNPHIFSAIPHEKAPAIHGHFPFKPEYKQWFVCAFVRDPIKQVTSRWKYHREKTKDKCTLTEFIKGVNSRLFTNMQTKFFNGGTVDDFNFIGITDYFDISVELFFKKIGLENKIVDPDFYKQPVISGLSDPGKHRNQSKILYEPSEIEIEIIKENSESDIELYKKAVQKFEKDCSKEGIKFEF